MILVRHAAHEPAIEPAAGDAVDHRHFLGNADRLAAIGDRIAEDADTAALGLPRDDRGRERHRRIDASCGLMVLVHHVVEAELVGDDVFVEVAVVEVCPDLRIEDPARDRHPHAVELVERRQIGIGHFGEMVELHGRSAPRVRRVDQLSITLRCRPETSASPPTCAPPRPHSPHRPRSPSGTRPSRRTAAPHR